MSLQRKDHNHDIYIYLRENVHLMCVIVIVPGLISYSHGAHQRWKLCNVSHSKTNSKRMIGPSTPECNAHNIDSPGLATIFRPDLRSGRRPTRPNGAARTTLASVPVPRLLLSGLSIRYSPRSVLCRSEMRQSTRHKMRLERHHMRSSGSQTIAFLNCALCAFLQNLF